MKRAVAFILPLVLLAIGLFQNCGKSFEVAENSVSQTGSIEDTNFGEVDENFEFASQKWNFPASGQMPAIEVFFTIPKGSINKSDLQLEIHEGEKALALTTEMENFDLFKANTPQRISLNPAIADYDLYFLQAQGKKILNVHVANSAAEIRWMVTLPTVVGLTSFADLKAGGTLANPTLIVGNYTISKILTDAPVAATTRQSPTPTPGPTATPVATASPSPTATPVACRGNLPGENINESKVVYSLKKIRTNWPREALPVNWTCPKPPAPPTKYDPPTFYLSDGVTKNPAYNTYMVPFESFNNSVNDLGDLYLQTESSEVAHCTMSWLIAWADSGIYNEYNVADKGRQNYTTTQGDYDRVWLVKGLLLNYAKIKDVPLIAANVTKFKSWMGKAMTPMQLFFINRILLVNGIAQRPENLNNHQYQAGIVFVLYGRLFGEQASTDLGVTFYKLGIDSIKADGTLETEMARGSQAFIYHIYALEHLVLLAEIETIYGDNLYSYKTSKISTLASLVIGAFNNFSTFTSKTTSKQIQDPTYMMTELPYYQDWMEIYLSRYGTKSLIPLVKTARDNSSNRILLNRRGGGKMTIAWGVPYCRLTP